jgi:hypothetical protein
MGVGFLTNLRVGLWDLADRVTGRAASVILSTCLSRFSSVALIV